MEKDTKCKGRGELARDPTISIAALDVAMDKEAARLDKIEAKVGYICSRYLGDSLISYVSEVPGEGGVDWGYTSEIGKAKTLSLYWKRRFVNDCRRCSAKAFVYAKKVM